MFLCKVCNAANGDAFPEGECYICQDAALKCDALALEAAGMLRKEEAASFCISTLIPKDWLAREERAWDSRLRGAESLKSFLNRRLIGTLRKETGLPYDGDGDCRVVLDYQSGKASISRNELFVFGRYMKRRSGLSQSRWKCSRCDGKGCAECDGKGKFYESVEERIGEPFRTAAGCDDYVMHASGREDVDATNSAGRPFVLELKNPKKRKLGLDGIADDIAKSGEVAVADMRIVPRPFVEVVTESHFDKCYEAETEFGRPVSEEDVAKIRAIEGRTVLQQTPTRVSHRRADLVRHRKIKHIEVTNIDGSRARLIIKAEAGTYIKELISGDRGRTVPSVAAELGTRAECKALEVTMIDDGFLDQCLAALNL